MVVKIITVIACICLVLFPLIAYGPLQWVTPGTEGAIMMLVGCVLCITAVLSDRGLPSLASPAILISSTIIVVYLLLRTDLTGTTQPDSALAIIPVFAGLLIALPVLIRQTNTANLLIILLLSFTLFESLLGLLQYGRILAYRNKEFIAGGTFITPAVYGNYLSLVIPFLIGILVYRKNRFTSGLMTCLLVITIITGTAAAIISSSRTSWIAIACGAAVVLLCRYGRTVYNWILYARLRMIAVFVLSLTIIAALAVWLLQYKAVSTAGRLFIYRQSMEVLKKHPLTGVGVNKFSVAYNLQQADYFMQAARDKAEILTADNINIAPGEWLQLTIETGIIGLLLGLLVSGVLLFKLLHGLKTLDAEMRMFRLSGAATVVALLCCMLFSYPLHTYTVSVMLLLILSVSFHKQAVTCYAPDNNTLNWLSKGVIVLSCLVALVWQLNMYNAERKWQQLQTNTFWLDYKTVKPSYEKLLPLLDGNFLFLSDYAALAYADGDYTQALALLNSSKNLFSSYLGYMYAASCYQQLNSPEKAYHDFKIACNMAPNRFLPKYRLFLFLVGQKRLKEAAVLKHEINTMPVKVPGKEVSLIKEKVNEVVLL